AVSAVLQVAGVLLPPLRELLGTSPLSALDLLACAAIGVLPGLVLRLTRRFRGTGDPRVGTDGPAGPAAGRAG
ncbi:cation transporting ATPase C-terminal domain-containing protein, partial [Micromonospora sp. NPDC005313]